MANVLGTLFGDIADAIREKTGGTDTMKPAEFPDAIRGIEAGASADVCYVIFMSHDGTVEYGRKPVAVGDDCADPIARGLFTTPTRESTAQYSYTFAGWATEVGGGLDSAALNAVKEDRMVYANYIAAVRYYTVTYYDTDGVTVLKTESLAYGTIPNYMPQKTGYSFESWVPAVSAVTGDAAYCAQWVEKITFARGAWADIAAVCEAGNAAEYFALGDTREIMYNSSVSLTAVIVGFGHDDLADGSGKAGMTVMVLDTPVSGINWGNSSSMYVNSPVYTALSNTVLPKLESDLISVMKWVKKDYDPKSTSAAVSESDLATFSTKLWSPSIVELGGDRTKFNSSLPERIANLGEKYAYFDTVTKFIFSETFWTRNHMRLNGCYNGIYADEYVNGLEGGMANSTSKLAGLIFAFSI